MIAAQPKFKLQWFDRNVIRTRWPKFNKNPLQHAGNLVMRIARGSIKRRSRLRGKPSPAGGAPYSRQPGSTPPFKQIFSLPFRMGYSVIIGMVGYGGGRVHGDAEPVPGLHEHGGTAYRYVYTSMGRKRLQNGRWGKHRYSYKKKLVKYPQRPFMWPALLRARAVLPSMWLNSVSGST